MTHVNDKDFKPVILPLLAALQALPAVAAPAQERRA